ncbi:MAG: DUF6404 family protein [Planctomycetes bacterium]|nr:DUF6404 family protein [Planctomycetota bacterium]
MNTNAKRDAALRLLAATGMRRSNYAPPLTRLLWRLGFDAPPPHLGTFLGNAILMGVFFGVGWGVLFGLEMSWWYHRWMQLDILGIAAVAAGVLFGLCMASIYSYGKLKHGLPSWQDFNPADGPSESLPNSR